MNFLTRFEVHFGLIKHQWYVCCDWNPDGKVCSGHLYTLPYAVGTLIDIGNIHSKWTCPNDKKYWLFDRVHTLRCKRSENERLDLHPARFSNIHDLTIVLPLSKNIWSVIPTFDRLTSLHASIDREESEFDLQALFDLTPRLYTLIIDNPHPLVLSVLCRLRSTSVRQLKLFPKNSSRTYYLDDPECIALAMSPLGRQCEVLNIQVESRENVVYLVNTMANLRAMMIYINCAKNKNTLPKTDEMSEWIQNHLRRKCLIDNCTNCIYTEGLVCGRGISVDMNMWIG